MFEPGVSVGYRGGVEIVFQSRINSIARRQGHQHTSQSLSRQYKTPLFHCRAWFCLIVSSLGPKTNIFSLGSSLARWPILPSQLCRRPLRPLRLIKVGRRGHPTVLLLSALRPPSRRSRSPHYLSQTPDLPSQDHRPCRQYHSNFHPSLSINMHQPSHVTSLQLHLCCVLYLCLSMRIFLSLLFPSTLSHCTS